MVQQPRLAKRRTRARCSANDRLPLRPLRLLARPRPLRVLVDEDGAPRAVGEGVTTWEPVEVRGPERIETAWGETGTPVRRDYYTVRDPDGRVLWLYSEQGAWSLHGVFD